ncbi:hypothetical protein BCR39DRAFT_558933 [Naematelia encephala]|uniref:Uncharacterized protein n=1 Tax=Naematelia encephala TaxID=71784 RepID=A0A1Y2B6T1_9TREE|nr:hypothetical protein BCR39DRAFT_558933 [Naematelia encephala]
MAGHIQSVGELLDRLYGPSPLESGNTSVSMNDQGVEESADESMEVHFQPASTSGQSESSSQVMTDSTSNQGDRITKQQPTLSHAGKRFLRALSKSANTADDILSGKDVETDGNGNPNLPIVGPFLSLKRPHQLTYATAMPDDEEIKYLDETALEALRFNNTPELNLVFLHDSTEDTNFILSEIDLVPATVTELETLCSSIFAVSAATITSSTGF